MRTARLSVIPVVRDESVLGMCSAVRRTRFHGLWIVVGWNGLAKTDPFVGSGSTVIASEQLGRVCYAMELSPYFAQVCLERWAQFTGKQWEQLEEGEAKAAVHHAGAPARQTCPATEKKNRVGRVPRLTALPIASASSRSMFQRIFLRTPQSAKVAVDAAAGLIGEWRLSPCPPYLPYAVHFVDECPHVVHR